MKQGGSQEINCDQGSQAEKGRGSADAKFVDPKDFLGDGNQPKTQRGMIVIRLVVKSKVNKVFGNEDFFTDLTVPSFVPAD